MAMTTSHSNSTTSRAKTYRKHLKFYLPRLVFDHLHYKLAVAPPVFTYDIDKFYSILNDLSNVMYSKATAADNGMLPLYSGYLKAKYSSEYTLYMRYLLNHCIIWSSRKFKAGRCLYFKLVDSIIYEGLLNREYYKNRDIEEVDNIPYCFPSDDRYCVRTLDSKEIKRFRNLRKNTEIVEIKIDVKSKVGRYITTQFNRERDRIRHCSDHIKVMERFYMDNLKIDVLRARDYCLNKFNAEIEEANGNTDLIAKAENAFDQRMQSIHQIGDKSPSSMLRFTRGKTNNRIDTNLTNMAADLRPFIIGFDQMSYLDLSNSQPVLFNIMLQKYKMSANSELLGETAIYEEKTLSGQWYEYLIMVFGIQGDTEKEKRDKAKNIWMQVAYSKNNYRKSTGKIFHRKEKKLFNKVFPEILKVIEQEKATNHENFSIGLQKIESRVFIDEISKELVEVGIIPYSMHDGFLVPKDKEEETYQIMERVLERILGRIPVIAINGVKRYPSDPNLPAPEIMIEPIAELVEADYPQKVIKKKGYYSPEELKRMAENRRRKSRNKIYDVLKSWSYETHGEPTPKRISQYTGMAVSTVKNNIGTLQPRIDEIYQVEKDRLSEIEKLREIMRNRRRP